MLLALASLSLALAQDPTTTPPADPAADPAADPTAVEAAPGPEPGPVAATPAPVAAPPAPRFRGVGLAIGAGVLGGLGLAVNLGRIGIVQAGCKAEGDVPDSVSKCISKLGGYLALSATAPFINIAATGLAGAAGGSAGRYEAWKTAYGGGRQRKAGAFIGSGAGVLGVGLIVYVFSRIRLFTDLYGAAGCSEKMDYTGACVRGRFSGWLAGITIGQSMVVSGTGLLSFGAAYAVNRPRTATARFHIDPVLAPTWTGLALRGQF